MRCLGPPVIRRRKPPFAAWFKTRPRPRRRKRPPPEDRFERQQVPPFRNPAFRPANLLPRRSIRRCHPLLTRPPASASVPLPLPQTDCCAPRKSAQSLLPSKENELF